MIKRLFLPLVMLAATVASAQTTEITSPNNCLTVTVGAEDGTAFYTVSRYGATVIGRSQLGFKTNYGDFSSGLTMEKWETTPMVFSYDMTRTKASHVDYNGKQVTATFLNTDGQRMQVELRVTDRDVAFRYHLLPNGEGRPKSAVVLSEASSFVFPDYTTTFLSPQSKPMVGWERTKPSYEEEYRADRPMTEGSAQGEGYVFPALFRIDFGPTSVPSVPSAPSIDVPTLPSTPTATSLPTDGNVWVLLTETGVNGSYVGAHLSDWDQGYRIAFPNAGENNGNGTPTAGVPVPSITPWRTITIGTLADIVETTVSYDLVEPLFEPSQQYQPGRYVWSWLIGQDESINYDDQVRFIDLASAMGFEYCLVDNWWDQRIGRDRIAKLSEYAQSKGVSLMLWYNSNGSENDAPQTPRQCMNTSIARDKEMAWMKSIGVKGIKVDFFGGDKQQTMQLYEDILSDANRYGLQVIFHGCTLPRGWERMYPNYVASEAVLASENVMFNEGAAIRQAFDLTLHPFCRNSTASMDWGGIIMNHHMSTDNASRHSRKTTDIFELASGIIMQTAVQCVAIQPNNLQELPQFELDFLRELPTTWDETRFIDGYPGKYVVLARRHGDRWYVAGLNATQESLRLSLQLGRFFKPLDSNDYYVDSRDKQPQLKKLSATKQGLWNVEMQPNGGFILK